MKLRRLKKMSCDCEGVRTLLLIVWRNFSSLKELMIGLFYAVLLPRIFWRVVVVLNVVAAVVIVQFQVSTFTNIR